MRGAPALLLLACCGGSTDDTTDDKPLPEPADADADSDADSDTDADTDADADSATPDSGSTSGGCVYPDVAIDPLVPGAAPVAPSFLSVSLSGMAAGGDLEDYTLYDTDAGAPIGDRSAVVVFGFTDAAGLPLCSVVYDLSLAAAPAVGGWTTGAPVALWDAWDLTLANGQTDCGPFPPELGGNPIAFVEGFSWGIGLGPSTQAFSDDLRAAVTADGGDWAVDWAPYVYSVYVATDGTIPPQVFEFGYGFQLTSACADLLVDAASEGTTDPAPIAGPLTGFQNTSPFGTFGLN